MSYASTDLKTYVFTSFVEISGLASMLDSRPEILNWISVTDRTVFIVSRLDANTLAARFHDGYPWMLFLLAEVDSKKANGFLHQSVWDFINNPRSSGRWP